MTIYKKDLIAAINAYERGHRSAWSRGVAEYARELVEGLERDYYHVTEDLRAALLNGAEDWRAYSWGGCSLIYDRDIAHRLCNRSEWFRTRGGERRPNAGEYWLDVQMRALYQAAQILEAVAYNGID